MVIRNEDKFRTRNKSRRNAIENSIFRPEIVAMIAAARDRLSFETPGTDFVDLATMKPTTVPSETTLCLHSEGTARVFAKGTLFLEGDIDGLGKNILTEESRRSGVEAYSFMIRLVALRCLFQLLQSTFQETEKPLLASLVRCEQWKGVRALLQQECKRVLLSEAAQDYTAMRKQLAERAVESKKKDFIRGEHIDPSYLTTHSYAKDMAVIDQFTTRIEREGEELTNLTNRILLWNEDCDLCHCSLVR